MSTQEQISVPDNCWNDQLAILDALRERLAELIRQRGLFGIHTSPDIHIDIRHTRGEIRKKKIELRAAGADVKDMPGDEEPDLGLIRPSPSQTQQLRPSPTTEQREQCLEGSPEHYVQLTQEIFVAQRRIYVVDQRKAVSSFIRMVHPDQQPYENHIMVIQDDHQGKTLALARFTHICRLLSERARIVVASIDLSHFKARSEQKIAEKIIQSFNDELAAFPEWASISGQLPSLPEPINTTRGRVSGDDLLDNLATSLCNYLGAIGATTGFTRVLLFDNFDDLPPNSKKWLLGFLVPEICSRIRENKLPNMVVVLAGRSGLDELKMDGIEWIPSICDIETRDVKQLANDSGLDITDDDAKEIWEDAEHNLRMVKKLLTQRKKGREEVLHEQLQQDMSPRQ